MALISRDLVTLKTDIEVPQSLQSLKISAPDPHTVLKFLKTQGFKRLTARFEVQKNNFEGTAELQNADQSETEKSYELIQERDLLEKWLEETHSSPGCNIRQSKTTPPEQTNHQY